MILHWCSVMPYQMYVRTALSLGMQGRVYAPGDSEDKMAAAIKDFNEFVIKDERVEVIALPFRDGVNIVQRRYSYINMSTVHVFV